jgi:hypothetical protein
MAPCDTANIDTYRRSEQRAVDHHHGAASEEPDGATAV